MKQYRKFIAGLLAVIISAGATGSLAYAKSNDRSAAESAVTASAENAAKASEKAARKPADGTAGKDETVYVLCNADASVKNVIVSDWLKNTKAMQALADVSGLQDIVNVKSDAAFSQHGDELDWDAEGEDIYYQGKTDKKPPVEGTMTYTRDGKTITPEHSRRSRCRSRA